MGAVNSGLHAVWFNWRNAEDRLGAQYETIHDLRDLPGVLHLH
jgi:hypothetical protein